ncbi:MAG TPA: carboxymuconolactone decarboxylase family protein [Acidimicrobiales bacterium]|nr:carboxymuconolactone decarboxylase family protein [Acidimicrobiales bacterium]
MTARIQPLPPEQRDDATNELLQSMRIGDGEVLNIFATLARHPRLLKRWSAFGGTLLFGGRLPGRDRELLILRTAHTTNAQYEWAQHVALGKAEGLTDDDIERVQQGPDEPGWAPFDQTLVRAADELHAAACIGDKTWAELAEKYDAQQLIEVCMVVGQYHLVAFTLNSLGVELES